MRLLLSIGTGNQIVRKPDISSFLIYDDQSFPVVLGVEYAVPTGIVRTFSDISEQDFHTVLQRSGIFSSVPSGGLAGASSILCIPFLGKGVPERLMNVSRVLAVNDHGKPLFAAWRQATGTFETSTYGAKDFDMLVQSLF